MKYLSEITLVILLTLSIYMALISEQHSNEYLAWLIMCSLVGTMLKLLQIERKINK